MKHIAKTLAAVLIVGTGLAPFIGCSNAAPTPSKNAAKISEASNIVDITSNEQFKAIVEGSKDELLVFKLYADWCGPCKILAPTMEKIAREHGKQAKFFRINVDKVPDVAASFGGNSIPMVVMVKNGQSVDGYVGVRTEEEYVQSITKHGQDEVTNMEMH